MRLRTFTRPLCPSLTPLGRASLKALKCPSTKIGLLGRLRRAIALSVYPEFSRELLDAKDSITATREALSVYRELLEESERQRRIDEDARHDWKTAACAYQIKFKQLQSHIKNHVSKKPCE